ncbi:ankyrin repeat-containing protein [Cocos nucifera]|nr:ankyrin repeat-containing protein [Cocos nucifera]
MSGNFPVVDEILKQCPHTDELLDGRGNNFLHAAFHEGKLDVVKKIISKRPDLKELLNEQDNMGDTPLHTAVRNSDQESVNFLLRDKNIHINVINNNNCTPLDLALQELDPGMSDKTNAASCILSCLAFTKALPGPPPELRVSKRVVSSSDEEKMKPSGIDEVKEKSPSDEAKKKPSGDDKVKENSSRDVEGEMKKRLYEEKKKRQNEELMKELDVPKNFVIATVLIATVTFAAGFTLPGGYIADDHPGRGTAVLSKEYAFKVFLVSDAFAFIFSILATFWFVDAGSSTIDRYTRSRALFFALWCLWLAFSGMFTAFAMGIYATLAHNYKTIGILLCIIVLSAPILANIGSRYNLYSFRKTVGIRQGYRHWIWPTTLHPHVETIFHSVLISRGAIIFYLLPVLGSYATFFLLPMLWLSKI